VSVRIAGESVERLRARIGELVARFEVGAVDFETVKSHVAAWRGHAMQGHTRALRERVMSEFVFVRRS